MQRWKQQWCDLSVTDLAETPFIPDIRSLKAEFTHICQRFFKVSRQVISSQVTRLPARRGGVGGEFPACLSLFYWF